MRQVISFARTLFFLCALPVLFGPALAQPVQDKWDVNLTTVNDEGVFVGLTSKTGIDRINVVGSQTTIMQTVVLNVALGNTFSETGVLQWETTSPEGGGAATPFGLGTASALYVEFVGVTGTLNLDGSVTFDAGSGSIKLYLDSDNDLSSTTGIVQELAEFSIVAPSGGSDLDFFGGAGANGTVDLTLELVSVIDTDLFLDENGNELDTIPLVFHLVNLDSLLDPNVSPNPNNTGLDAMGNGISLIHVQNNGQWNITQAPDTPVDALGHFKLYEVDDAEELDPEPVVNLLDQFGPDLGVEVGEAEYFGNPVTKIHDGEVVEITNPDAHLTCYEIEDGEDEPERRLTIENQFGLQTLVVEEAELLCVPTVKLTVDWIPVGDGAVPNIDDLNIDHFKLYEVDDAEELEVVVDLLDQFHEELGVEVEEAEYFGNPVDKNGEGIIDEASHLTCYEIEDDGDDEERRLEIVNQFGEQTLEVEEAELLCVPTRKLLVVVIEEDDDDDDDDDD